MIHDVSATAVLVFSIFVAITLGISFYFGAKAKSSSGYFAAHGQIHWFVNGVAFAGDYLSAASFLGICGMIAFFGYDGFLYSIGYLAGWVVALFVIAEPLKRLGKYTFADALDSTFQSRGVKLAAAISTLAVSVFYLIPQMVGAGVLIKPLLGLPHYAGVLLVGAVVILIVTTAGMVSTTYVQFLKGSLLLLFSLALVIMILNRGLSESTEGYVAGNTTPRSNVESDPNLVPPSDGWVGKPYFRIRHGGDRVVLVYRESVDNPSQLVQCVLRTVTKDGRVLINGVPQGREPGQTDHQPVGFVYRVPEGMIENPNDVVHRTGPLGPGEFLGAVSDSQMVLWNSEVIAEADGGRSTVYSPKVVSGQDIMKPGNHPAFRGIRSEKFSDKINFLSLMLALFCGTASLPHILIRYYTVKDQSAARKSTVVGIGSIGIFYILTLFLGLGAMTSGRLDITDSNMSAPLLARSFGEFMFAAISAIAFTTVLGTVSGLIVAASGAVAHDLLSGVFRKQLTDQAKVRAGKLTAVGVGCVAVMLGILFQNMNVNYLVGWAFSVAASANLPALLMLLFWKGTTKQGVIAGVTVGMVSSLAWILLSGDTFKDVYKIDPQLSPVPFSQPGIVTIPLSFIVLIAVSLVTRKRTGQQVGSGQMK